jgi:AcrR family transcriptional regulator
MPADEEREQPEDDSQVSLWERLDRPTPVPRPALSPRRLAKTAVRIADAEGLDAVTMRRLATEMGVAPMAAYRYVSGKDELIELMVDSVYAGLDLPFDTNEWRAVMRTVALRVRDVLLAHPWVGRATYAAVTPNQLTVPERALAALDGLGLDVDMMMVAHRTVIAYVHGAVDSEIGMAWMMRARKWSSPTDAGAALSPQMTWLVNTGQYIEYMRYLAEATHQDDLRWQFETGLDCVLDGIAARLGI